MNLHTTIRTAVGAAAIAALAGCGSLPEDLSPKAGAIGGAVVG